MSELADVKKRTGKSPSRAEKAAATRQRILDAAQQLFTEHGYASTTMQAIGDAADVAVQTVYFVFHTKGELVSQLLKSVGARPSEPIHTMDRDWVQEALTDPDGRRSLALMVEHGTDIYARVTPVWAAIGQAAAVEPEVANVWNGIAHQRLQGVRTILGAVADRGHLRDGLTADRAADIVYGLHRPETFTVFVDECGWAVEEFKAWSYRMLCEQILEPEAAPAGAEPPTRGLAFDELLA